MKRNQESLFSIVFNSSPLSISIATVEGGRMIAFNKSCVESLGYPEEVLAHNSTVDLGIWLDPNERAQFLRVLQEQGRCEGWKAQLVRSDGQVRDTVLSAQLIDLEVGRCILTFGRDVTEQRRAERSLRESQERFEQSFTSATIGKAIVGLDGRWIEVNPALCRLLGYSEKELLQLTFQDITHPDDLDADLNHLQKMLAGIIPTYHMEKRYFHQQGQEVCVLLSVSMVRDAQGLPLYFISEIQDITERKRYEQHIAQQQQVLEEANAKLEQLATTDSLTGLRNRRSFDDHLQQEVERAARQQAPLSLLLLDVDHFKSYNDTFGHPAGDVVLRQVAQLVQAQSRSIDIPARYGGEEFAVVLPGTDQAGAMTLAERFCRAFEGPLWPLRAITASIGIATWGPPATGVVQAQVVHNGLVSQADGALYQAKRSGRNRVVHAADVVRRKPTVNQIGS